MRGERPQWGERFDLRKRAGGGDRLTIERQRQAACPRPHASWWRTDTTRLTSAGRRKRRGNERHPSASADCELRGEGLSSLRLQTERDAQCAGARQSRRTSAGSEVGGGVVTALRRDRSHDPEFVSNPSQPRAMEQTVGNSRFKGIRLLWLPKRLGRRRRECPPSESAKRACAALPALLLLIAHAHCKSLCAALSATGRLRKRVGFLSQGCGWLK